MGKTVDARSTRDLAEIFYQGELVKTHVRKPKGKQTDFADYPPEKVAFFMKTPTWCRKRAAEIGPSCAVVIEELLGGEHGLHHLEAACRRALDAGDPSYRTIKAILATTADPPHNRRHPPPNLLGPAAPRAICGDRTPCSPRRSPPPMTRLGPVVRLLIPVTATAGRARWWRSGHGPAPHERPRAGRRPSGAGL